MQLSTKGVLVALGAVLLLMSPLFAFMPAVASAQAGVASCPSASWRITRNLSFGSRGWGGISTYMEEPVVYKNV